MRQSAFSPVKKFSLRRQLSLLVKNGNKNCAEESPEWRRCICAIFVKIKELLFIWGCELSLRLLVWIKIVLGFETKKNLIKKYLTYKKMVNKKRGFPLSPLHHSKIWGLFLYRFCTMWLVKKKNFRSKSCPSLFSNSWFFFLSFCQRQPLNILLFSF